MNCIHGSLEHDEKRTACENLRYRKMVLSELKMAAGQRSGSVVYRGQDK